MNLRPIAQAVPSIALLPSGCTVISCRALSAVAITSGFVESISPTLPDLSTTCALRTFTFLPVPTWKKLLQAEQAGNSIYQIHKNTFINLLFSYLIIFYPQYLIIR